MDGSQHNGTPGDVEGEVIEVADLRHQRTPQQRAHRWAVWSAGGLLGERLSRRQRFWRLGTTLGALLLVATLVGWGVLGSALAQVHDHFAQLLAPQPTSTPMPQAAPLSPAPTPTPLPQEDGLACLVDAAWSPDGTHIAVVGYRQGCATSAGVLTLYNGRSGALLQQLQPDSAIVATLRPTTPPGASPDAVGTRLGRSLPPLNIAYGQVLWSPTASRLALIFYLWEPGQNAFAQQGVLLVDTDGGHAQVLTQPQGADSQFFREWDLVRGVPRLLSANQQANFLPAAFGYRWTANGSLVPVIPLLSPSSLVPAPPRGPVGNPDGSASFTIWQPATLPRVSLQQDPAVYVLYTDFTAWSPDGRYLIYDAAEGAILVPPGHAPPSRTMLDPYHFAQAPFLPMRDAGLEQATRQIAQDAAPPVVAWRPDGRMLAVYTPGVLGSAADRVTLYDCGSGRQLAMLPLPGAPVGLAGGPDQLLWAPDGQRLLLSSSTWGIVTLWGPDRLP
jgi:WD40-like Beta Propeller Repeat